MNFTRMKTLWHALQRRWWWRLLTTLVIGLAVYFGITAYQTRELVDDGELAPPFTLRDVDGAERSLTDYQGKKTLLVFWAPWCKVCLAEMDTLTSIAADGDVHVVSVVLEYDDVESVRRTMEAHDVRFPVLLGTASTASDYRIDTFPTLYVLDEDGRVQHAVLGYTLEPALRVRLAL